MAKSKQATSKELSKMVYVGKTAEEYRKEINRFLKLFMRDLKKVLKDDKLCMKITGQTNIIRQPFSDNHLYEIKSLSFLTKIKLKK